MEKNLHDVDEGIGFETKTVGGVGPFEQPSERDKVRTVYVLRWALFEPVKHRRRYAWVCLVSSSFHPFVGVRDEPNEPLLLKSFSQKQVKSGKSLVGWVYAGRWILFLSRHEMDRGWDVRPMIG